MYACVGVGPFTLIIGHILNKLCFFLIQQLCTVDGSPARGGNWGVIHPVYAGNLDDLIFSFCELMKSWEALGTPCLEGSSPRHPFPSSSSSYFLSVSFSVMFPEPWW